METRVNTFGEKEVKIQPNGLPAIWVKLYCDRCRRFQACLGFNDLSESEWGETNNVISSVNMRPSIVASSSCAIGNSTLAFFNLITTNAKKQ